MTKNGTPADSADGPKMSKCFKQSLMDYSKFKSQNQIERINTIVSKKRCDVIKWNGWGYNDSKFVVDNGVIIFTGKRYPIGEVELPYFTEWVQKVFDIDLNQRNIPASIPPPEAYPDSKIPDEFTNLLGSKGISWSKDGFDRLVRCHGQTLHDIYSLRQGLKEGIIPKIPDVVVWPETHEDVIEIVNLAEKFGVVIIPYGGGTSVSGASTCPEFEDRSICALDTLLMNGIKWLDPQNLLICCQSGIMGQDLESYLKTRGYTTGHEPDSYEFSTIGGWVATRASGMKKNIYGNIEDIVVSVKMVTPRGVLQRVGINPRQSTGPDFNHIILGSEGTLGVITDVVLKIRPLAKYKKYGSVVFPHFEAGVACMREVARQKCQPASIRLMDNEQFQFGQALRPRTSGLMSYFSESVKKAYLTKIKGFELNQICVTTLLFEGDKKNVELQEAKIYEIAKECGGIPAGEKNGERGYTLTFVIAYIRDLALEYYIVAESFETSVPWDQTINLCKNVKYVVDQKCQEFGIKNFLISHRVTQTYDCGCCVYFYFGFNWRGMSEPVTVYEQIEEAARDEILACGGSLSHHHGVGKLRSRWYKGQVSDVGEMMYKQAKLCLDPNNTFATGNLLVNAKL
ncbi:alkyldihydroxyacetonephosphate synthase [Cimex lectularius]|uniref:Alkylglycerone-phosphate synthase n=1 Tax=Cimex lectularius TaxID=79782 RepID=A0A8I6S771_CIMLE|nr:alkyldihydroxyacetonephosphate synthase [Cimex lectularius]XP_014257152.1 alkyldihydroxyacetonephosphate synthase [Cimex lectularius]